MTTSETVAGLMTVANGWKEVAENRLALIETLKVELRKANHELDRLLRHGVMSNTTRVAVINNLGMREFWADDWSAHFQDDGRTLRLFGNGAGADAREGRNKSLAEDIASYCLGCGSAPKGAHNCGRNR